MSKNSNIRYFKKRLKYSNLSDTWQNILRREYVYNSDGEYTARLQKAIGDAGGMLANKTQPRPTAIEVELALQQGCREESDAKNVWQRRLQQLYRAKHKRISIEAWIAQLDGPHWLDRFIARQVLAYRGGEVVKPLSQLARATSGQQKDTAIWLLQSISMDTCARLALEKDNLLCPQCLIRCAELWIDLPWQPDITYCGCRSCGQSRRFIHCPHPIVAVLDNTWLEEMTQDTNRLRVNWFGHQTPFDFDSVEIINATDEEVERFAVRVSNYSDSAHQERFNQIDCPVRCNLSKNTLRILVKMFGRVSV